MVNIKVQKSAFKHGITERKIRAVLADKITTKAYTLHNDLLGNPQEMLVGYTHAGMLLEVAVCYTDECDYVFHARRASAKYKQLYKENH